MTFTRDWKEEWWRSDCINEICMTVPFDCFEIVRLIDCPHCKSFEPVSQETFYRFTAAVNWRRDGYADGRLYRFVHDNEAFGFETGQKFYLASEVLV